MNCVTEGFNNFNKYVNNSFYNCSAGQNGYALDFNGVGTLVTNNTVNTFRTGSLGMRATTNSANQSWYNNIFNGTSKKHWKF